MFDKGLKSPAYCVSTHLLFLKAATGSSFRIAADMMWAAGRGGGRVSVFSAAGLSAGGESRWQGSCASSCLCVCAAERFFSPQPDLIFTRPLRPHMQLLLRPGAFSLRPLRVPTLDPQPVIVSQQLNLPKPAQLQNLWGTTQRERGPEKTLQKKKVLWN